MEVDGWVVGWVVWPDGEVESGGGGGACLVELVDVGVVVDAPGEEVGFVCVGVDVVVVVVEPGGLVEEVLWLSEEGSGCSGGGATGMVPLVLGMEGTLISVALGLFGWVVTGLISPSVDVSLLPLGSVFVLEPLALNASAAGLLWFRLEFETDPAAGVAGTSAEPKAGVVSVVAEAAETASCVADAVFRSSTSAQKPIQSLLSIICGL